MKKSSPYRSLGLFSVIVAEMAGYTGAGVALGYLAWKKAGFPWWVIIITTNLGLILAMMQIYRLYMLHTKNDDETEEPPKPVSKSD